MVNERVAEVVGIFTRELMEAADETSVTEEGLIAGLQFLTRVG